MPNFAAAHSNLASILKEQGRFDQAISHYQQALMADPKFSDAYRCPHGLWECLCYRRWVTRRACGANGCADCRFSCSCVACCSNMGNAFKDLGRLDEAIRCYTTAIKLRPTFADAYSNLASAYKVREHPLLTDTHALHPDVARTWTEQVLFFCCFVLSHVVVCCGYFVCRCLLTVGLYFVPPQDGGKIEEAIACYRKALELRPYFPDAFSNLIHSLVLVCDWKTREEDFAKTTDLLEEQVRTAMAHSAAVFAGTGSVASTEGEGWAHSRMRLFCALARG